MRATLFLLAALVGGGAAGAHAASDIELPAGPGRDLVYGQCRTCHDLQYIVDSAGITPGDWEATIDSMRQYGLRIPAAQRAQILEYLGTYLGPNPPKPSAEAAPAAAANGETVYAEQCAACHQPHGQGSEDQFPPLAGNADLFLDRLFPVYVVLNGLEGPLQVKGKRFDSAMPPFNHLSDAEIAAVVNFVRSSWNNASLRPAGMKEVDAAAVEKARAKPMKPNEVLSYRARNK